MAKIDMTWWNALDLAWKRAFQQAFEFAGEPTPATLKQIAGATHVYAAKTAITTLAPLADLPELVNVDVSGCAQLASMVGLPRTIRHVTFHWMSMDDISWVDALPALERVYCDKPLQAKINRRIGVNKRRRS
jgi:hypothetical protein